MIERRNQTMLIVMVILKERQKRDWNTFVPSLMHAYNATIHESNNCH